MRHRLGYKKLNRTSEHRKALIKNMLNNLIKYEQIITTLPKAKVLKPQADKIITLGKKKNLQNTKRLVSQLQDKTNANKVIKEVKSSEPEFNRNLLKRVEELELSVRSMNCLKNDNIIYIGDLVQKSEGEMLRTPNFGRKSLNEIKEVLNGMSLYLGMEIPNWPPDNIAELSKKLEESI